MDGLRAIPGSCPCVLLDAPFSSERICGVRPLLDSDTVDEVRGHGVARRVSRTLIRIHKQPWLRHAFQIVFLPLHSFISGGGRNSAVSVGFSRVRVPTGCPGLGRKLVAGPYCHPVPALESKQDSAVRQSCRGYCNGRVTTSVLFPRSRNAADPEIANCTSGFPIIPTPLLM
jgi:hypothetical protein